MPLTWTSEQVIALSPDAKSTKNGQGLATLSTWQTLGKTESAIWGECKGSGKKPYRTQIDLNEPAFRCSCPSRKFPCKHALGLFLLLTSHASEFEAGVPPDWVQSWLNQRSQKQAKSDKKTAKADPTAQAKRAANREKKVQAGIADLDRWLSDLVRQGFANVKAQSYRFWEQPAARMVDAQAPGLARRLREMSSLCHQGQDWPQHLLRELGKLHLLIQGYQRIETLPPPVQAELRSQIGWTIKQDDLLAQSADSAIETVVDTWHILGRRVIVEDRLRTQRLWLEGSQGRTALLLSFAYGSTPLDTSLRPGCSVEAELVFFPGLYPLRAVIKSQKAPQSLGQVSGGSIKAGLEKYGLAIAENPWLYAIPWLLESVVPYYDQRSWVLVDGNGHQISMQSAHDGGDVMALMAASGGYPCNAYGEWDGRVFYPLGLWVNDQFQNL